MIEIHDVSEREDRLAQLADLYAAGDIGPDGWFDATYNIYITGTGQVITGVHPASACAERGFCCVHAPSVHSMREFPTLFRYDRYLMERVCPHGVGHPDPDDARYQSEAMPERASGVHGCDGCCHPEGRGAFWEKVVKADDIVGHGQVVSDKDDWPMPRTLEGDEMVSVVGCARCGDDHRLLFRQLERPMRVGKTVWTHWGSCPATGEPVMLRFAEETRNG